MLRNAYVHISRPALVFLIAVIIPFTGVSAQSLTGVDSTCSAISGYCTPGVQGMTPGSGIKLGAESLPGIGILDEDGNLRRINRGHHLYASLKIPVILTDGFKLFTGFGYSEVVYSSKQLQGPVDPDLLVPDQRLKSSGAGLYAVKSLGPKWYLGIKGTVYFRGNYDGLVAPTSTNTDLMTAVAIGRKPSEKLEWAVGAAHLYWNNKNLVIPVALFNYSFGKYGVEALLPSKVFGRYNLSDTRVLYAGLQYSGFDYIIQQGSQGNATGIFNQSILRYQVNIEQRLTKWIWADIRAGYQSSLSFEMAVSDVNYNYPKDPSGGVFCGFELSVRPPANLGSKGKSKP